MNMGMFEQQRRREMSEANQKELFAEQMRNEVRICVCFCFELFLTFVFSSRPGNE